MKKEGFHPSAIIPVACPTCGVSAGRRSILESGGPRSSSHVNRKLAAAEKIEAMNLPSRGKF